MEIEDLLSIQNLIGLIGLLLTVYGVILTLRFKENKIIKYFIPFKQLIFANQFIDLEQFDLKLNGSHVRDIFALEIMIENAGNVIITKQDFIKPIQVKFSKPINLFPVKILRKKSDIPFEYKIFTNENRTILEILTEFVEPKDFFDIRILYESDEAAEITLDARILNGELKQKSMLFSEPNKRDTYKKIIHGRYKEQMKLFSAALSTILIFIILKTIEFLVPDFKIENLPILYKIIGFSLAFAIISILSINLVFLAYKKIIDRDLKEIDKYLEKRRNYFNHKEKN